MTTSSLPSLSTILARDAMHAPVIAVDLATPASEVADLMGRHRIHAVVVNGIPDAGGEGAAWGVVSDRDLLRAALDGKVDAKAGRIAATELITVAPTDDLEVVSSLLIAHECSHAIVVHDDEPIGVISTLDIVSALGG